MKNKAAITVLEHVTAPLAWRLLASWDFRVTALDDELELTGKSERLVSKALLPVQRPAIKSFHFELFSREFPVRSLLYFRSIYQKYTIFWVMFVFRRMLTCSKRHYVEALL